MIWTRISRSSRFLAGVVQIVKERIFIASLAKLNITRGVMAKQLQNAQTICGTRIGWDTENDDIMILVTPRTFSPVPDNDQETVCWFEPFVDEVSGVPQHHFDLNFCSFHPFV